VALREYARILRGFPVDHRVELGDVKRRTDEFGTRDFAAAPERYDSVSQSLSWVTTPIYCPVGSKSTDASCASSAAYYPSSSFSLAPSRYFSVWT
jgi:hypothetical protein